MKMFTTLGIDTGYGNCGLAILRVIDGKCSLIYSENFKTAKDADFIFSRNYMVVRRIRELCQLYSPYTIAMEAPALSKKHGMVSTGACHGSIHTAILDMQIPFTYTQPSVAKYMLTGTHKATKREVQDAIQVLFDRPKRLETNQSDAASLALLGAAFGQVLSGTRPCLTDVDAARTQEVLFSERLTKSSKRKVGILRRFNEFCWVPERDRSNHAWIQSGNTGQDAPQK